MSTRFKLVPPIAFSEEVLYSFQRNKERNKEIGRVLGLSGPVREEKILKGGDFLLPKET